MKKILLLFILLPNALLSQQDLILASVQQATPACSTGYFTDNAASLSPCEANSTSGWTPDGSDYTISSISSPIDDGAYSLEFIKGTAAGVNAIATLQLSGLTVGESYTITFKAYVSTPGNSNNNYVRTAGSVSGDWSTTGQSEIDPGGTFVEYSFVSTPSITNPRIEVASSTAGVNVVGLTIILDSILIELT